MKVQLLLPHPTKEDVVTSIAFPSSLWFSKTFPGVTLEVVASDGTMATVYIKHGDLVDKQEVLVSYIVNNYTHS